MSESLFFAFQGNNIGYGFDVMEQINQKYLENIKQHPPVVIYYGSWIICSVIGSMQTVAAAIFADKALCSYGLKIPFFVPAMIGSLALPILLRPLFISKQPTTIFDRYIALGNHVATLTHSILMISCLAISLILRDHSSGFALILSFGFSLAYGLADRAKAFPPSISKAIDWTRFGLLEYEWLLRGKQDPIFTVGAIGMFFFQIEKTNRIREAIFALLEWIPDV